ncbi:Tigger transposable element-derived protein 6 [Eumeta japonica]|uniref:Tigger transposable element-derived protein 6 n=1 Tax=Eumeta variegata TaxID=151549 RepID=A0A4C1SC01_EUMVA|nr:Tigger transposable element-derived protein 6 [Eumeta japonica]
MHPKVMRARRLPPLDLHVIRNPHAAASESRRIDALRTAAHAHNDIPQMKAVKIQYLLANTTSKLQPMNQGIIKNFKSLYRKEVVRNMLDIMEEKKNSTIDVLHAMRIADKAWRNITATTIKNCYVHCGFSLSLTEEAETENISPPAE